MNRYRSVVRGILTIQTLYTKYIEKSLEEVSKILAEREATPATVNAFYTAALEKFRSSSFLDPLTLATEFSLPKEMYKELFDKYIRGERHNEADFLCAVKLCYELKLPRTRSNVKALQERILDSSIPQNPEISLSSWIYLTSGQYSMSDAARNEIEYPEDKLVDMIKYLSSDEFINSIPKVPYVYSALGIFLGRNISTSADSTLNGSDSLVSSNVLSLMKKEPSMKAGWVYGLTLVFSSLDPRTKEKIWRLANSDKLTGLTLFSGLGRNFTSFSADIQNKILQKAEENEETDNWFAFGLGFIFMNLRTELQEKIWRKASERPYYGNRLAPGLSYSYQMMDRSLQEKLWKMARDSPEFALPLGTAIGRIIAYFDKSLQTELFNKIRNEGNSLLDRSEDKVF